MNNPTADIKAENTAALLPSTVPQHRKQQISGHSVHQVSSIFREFIAYVSRRNMTQIHVTKSICIEIGGRCLLAGKAHTLEAMSSIERWVFGFLEETIFLDYC